MSETKGTILTTEDLIKTFQDFYKSLPDNYFDYPTINYEEAKFRDEQMRKARFDDKTETR